jgi:hypothetical protein
MTDPPLPNWLFAKRAAIIASRAASWASDTLAEDLNAPVSLPVAERFAADIRHMVDITVRDAKANGRK